MEDEFSSDLRNVVIALDEPIPFALLSKRISTTLKSKNIRTFYDLCAYSENTIRAEWANFGPVTIAVLKEIVEERGLHLGMDVDGVILKFRELESAKVPPGGASPN
jgi:DNA-directed RNA polymerase subunit alpha